ncbi:translocation/assembly module TamB domain-containing protein [Aquamicrobium segne]|uniref:Translocation/assembly module TamB domain-containing protein n=1 Tax=Aquamicrobium segne TaxID=469547 RepID=A0ABW0H0P4_9HYPH
MKIAKRLLRIVFYAMLVVIAGLAGAVVVLTTTERGRDNLAGLVSSLASTADSKVAIRGIEGIWSGNLKIAGVVLEDREGPWLALRDVAVDWSPFSLISRNFLAERVAVGRIEVARAPIAGEQEKPSTSGGFSLPVSVDIRQIDLPQIVLGQALAGAGIAELGARGRVRAERSPLALEADLSVARRDGRQGLVSALVRFLPNHNQLELDVRASEPAGGIIANLLQLPDAPPVNISLSGNGPLADWAGHGTFYAGGELITEISGSHAFINSGNGGQGSRVELRGQGDFARFVPAQFNSLLAGKTRFEIAASMDEARGLTIETATVDMSALKIVAQGSVNPAGATDFSLDFSSVGPTVPLGLGSTESPLDLELRAGFLRAFGEGRSPMVDIEVQLDQVATNDMRVNNIVLALHSDEFDLEKRSGPISGTASADRIDFDNPTVAPLIAGHISALVEGDLSQDTITISKGEIASDALKGGFDGNVSLADGSIELNVKADVASNALPAAAHPALGERATLILNLGRDENGNVNADKLEFLSGPLSATGKASLVDGNVAAELNGALADIAPFASNASGAIALGLRADGSLIAPDVALTVSSDRLTVAEREITGLKLDATARADMASPAADVTLAGNVAGEVLQGKVTLKTEGGQSRIDDLTILLGPNRIDGDLVLDEAFLPEGRIGFELPDLGPLAALALEKLEGALNGSITFTKPDGVPQMEVKAATQHLVRDDLSAQNVTVDALIANYAQVPAISGSIQADGVTASGTAITGIAVDLKQDGEWTAFSGGATVKDIPANAGGRVKVAQGVTTLELQSGQATFQGVRAAIAEPSVIEVKDGRTVLERLVIGLGNGRIVVSGAIADALDIKADLNAVPVSLANNFVADLEASGAISGMVTVSGPVSAPMVKYDLKASDLAAAQTRNAGLGGVGIISSGNFANNRLEFTSTISEGSGLKLQGGGTVGMQGAPDLALNFNGDLPFAIANRMIAEQGMSMNGTATIAVQVRGPASSPAISGTIRSSGGRFLAAQAGLAVNDIALDISMGNNVATINQFTGKLSSGGTLTVGGTVGTDVNSGFPADLTIGLADGRYTDGHLVTANLGGDLSIKGPLAQAPVLTGAINLGRTVITVPTQLPTSLSELNVQHKNAPEAVLRQDQALYPSGHGSTSSSNSAMTLDLSVNAPNSIFVQGRGVDAELGGNIRLTGSASAPEAVGDFKLQRGRLEILGKRLNFTQGTLTFSGSTIPYLNLVATTTASDATVNISVTGEATNPKFVFSSVPALPEDEVLARLIFGRSMSNLSPLQIAQLAEAAAQLAGVGGSTSLLQNLRNAIRVDDLDVITDEQGGTSVQAGKYLNDRTYVTIQKGEKPGSGKARIDLDVGRGIKLRGEATDAGEARGGIFYEKEY